MGVWYACNEDSCRPHGQMLVVEQAGSTFTGSLLSAGAAPGPNINQDAIWEVGRSPRLLSVPCPQLAHPLWVRSLAPSGNFGAQPTARSALSVCSQAPGEVEQYRDSK